MPDAFIKIDTSEFERTRKEYMRYTKRDLATVLNTKASFIARRAILETPKADKSGIRTSLMQKFSTEKVTKGGKIISGTAPLVALIVNARKKNKGEKGLYGAAMRDAVKIIIAARLRSVAFIKSGWLPAVKALVGLAEKKGAPRLDGSTKQIGAQKGGATPARDSGWNQSARIWNTASTKRDKKGALEIYGVPGLKRAFDFEVRSMKEHIERKMLEGAKKLGIRTR